MMTDTMMSRAMDLLDKFKGNIISEHTASNVTELFCMDALKNYHNVRRHRRTFSIILNNHMESGAAVNLRKIIINLMMQDEKFAQFPQRVIESIVSIKQSETAQNDEEERIRMLDTINENDAQIKKYEALLKKYESQMSYARVAAVLVVTTVVSSVLYFAIKSALNF